MTTWIISAVPITPAWQARQREVRTRPASGSPIPRSFQVGQWVRLAYGEEPVGKIMAVRDKLLRVKWPEHTRWCSAGSITAIL